MITESTLVLRSLHCDRCTFATKPRNETEQQVLERAQANNWLLGFDAVGRPLHVCRRCRTTHGDEVLPDPPTPTSIARAAHA